MADSEKRLRTHTEQGAEMYEATRDKYIISFEDSWKCVDNSMNIALQKSEKELSRQYEFCKISKEVKNFIVRTNTAQSKEDFDKLGLTVDQRVKAVNDTFTNMYAIEQSLLESASHQSARIKKTSKSRSTTGSSSSKRTVRNRSIYNSISSEQQSRSILANQKIIHKQSNRTNNGEENHTPEVSSICTKVCGADFNGKSCLKTILAKVYKQIQPKKAVIAYIILDDQSNRSLAGPELFPLLHLKGNSSEYKLTSCAGTMNTFGRRATGLVIESLDWSTSLQLRILFECDIPNIREEIPSPAVARHHDHLREIADYIPEIDDTAPILLLIGHDLPEAHHVIEQLTGPTYSPYAQTLRLGWMMVGETCLNRFHRPKTVTVNKTYLLRNGRSAINYL
ncbi:Hypothetical predicted protein [Mytilus galloprovincialis]|uniref:Uncharacterized protein n=1 Tax=Mytilus galloprovincialis TaxID=29158 RepID=A0A8B6EZX0_MYTGA|nr:Hypothetical predicted protein [Mytilus galloprovincialis]